MLQNIERETHMGRKSRLLYHCYQSGTVNRSELLAFLEGQIATAGDSGWGRYCKRLQELAAADGQIDVSQLLKKLRSDFLPAREKLQMLHLHLSQVGDLQPVLDWVNEAAESKDTMLRMGARRIQSLIRMREQQQRDPLDYSDVSLIPTPQSLEEFLSRPRTVKLYWLMDEAQDSSREAFLYRHAEELLSQETDPFVLSNLVKRLPQAILWSGVLDLELVEKLTRFWEHEDPRVQSNLIEGYSVLMSNFRYRGKLYPRIVEATESVHPRVKTTALRVRFQYAPNETRRQVEGWLQRIDRLEDLSSMRWLIKALPDLYEQTLPAILALEERLLLGPEFYQEPTTS